MTRSQIPVLKNVIMGAPGCADGAVESPCTVCRPTAEALCKLRRIIEITYCHGFSGDDSLE